MRAALRDGMVVQLTCAVKNDEPDRRQKYDWRVRPVWQEGVRLIVIAERHATANPEDPVPLYVELSGDRHSILHRLHVGRLPAAVINALEPVKPTLYERFQHRGWTQYHSGVLDALVMQGKVTEDDCLAALDTWLEREV